MKDMLFAGIDSMPDNDYHPVELIVSAANSLYIYATLVQKGMSEEEIAKTMKQMATDLKPSKEDNKIELEPEDSSITPQNVTSLLNKLKKKNETVH